MKDQLNAKNRKKQRKAIRSAKKIPPIQEPSTTKYPKKIEQKRKELIDSFKRHMKIKKARNNTKNSKRTTPGIGITTTEAQPAHTHVEGIRWIKTTIKQNLAKQNTLIRQSTRKKSH